MGADSLVARAGVPGEEGWHPVSGSSRRTSDRRPWLAIGAGLVLASAGLMVWRSEHQVMRARATVDRQVELMNRGRPIAYLRFDAGDSDNPRVRITHAAFLAFQGSGAEGAARRRLIGEARKQAYLAIAARPRWGEAHTTLAYIETLAAPERTEAALASLSASYRDAPFLKGAAEWRVALALRGWHRLDEATQGRAINEAVWIARQEAPARQRLFDLAGKTDAYSRLLIAWRSAREKERLDTYRRE